MVIKERSWFEDHPDFSGTYRIGILEAVRSGNLFVSELEGSSPMPNLKQRNPQMNYFQEEDILHLLISDEAEAGCIEIKSQRHC